MPSVARALPVPLAQPLGPPILALLTDYRRLLNEILREAILTGVTSRGSMSRFARDRALQLQLTGQHAVVAAEVALSLAKSHRRRLRQGLPSRVPYVRQRFLRTNPATFHLDPASGRVRLSLRNGQWSSFELRLSRFHRERLLDPRNRVKQLHLTPERAIFTFERQVPAAYSPTALLALDTNERSLDGVEVTRRATRAVQLPFPQVRAIQEVHVARRRRLARKKATDRRVGKRLLDREGRRERHRVRSRLHLLTRALVLAAVRHRAAIALEDLSRLARLRPRRSTRPRDRWRRGRSDAPRSPTLRRRLSSWPRRELHRQIEYKASEHGVPIYWVNPFRTSTTCPKCGVCSGPRSRVGSTFVCANPDCGWRLDRQVNAGANVGRTVLRDYGRTELGGLRLALDALSREAMRPRYPFEKVGRARVERMVREGNVPGPGLGSGRE